MNNAEPQSLNKQDFLLFGLLGLTILLLSRYLLVWPTPLIFPAPGFQYGTDLMRESWSIFRYTSDVFHQVGTLPLWRPYLLSGAPLIGHPVAPVMYPPNWIVLILPLPLAFNLLIAFHLWWAGAGIYLYLRMRAGLKPEAAFIGAMIFALSPRLFTHIGGGHLPLIEAVAWWPWAWFAFSQYWHSKQVRWMVLLGVALAAHALTDGRYAAMTGVCIAVATVYQIGRGRLPALRAAILSCLVAGPIALGLAASVLGPFAELLPYTNRVTLTQAETTGGLEPAFLINVLFRSSIVEPESYTFLGITVIVIILFGVSTRRSYPEKWWALALFITIILSLGTNTPLAIYALLLRYVPIFQAFRAPGRWYPYAIYAVAVLAAWGYDKWSRGLRTQRWLQPLLIGLSLLYLGVSVGASVMSLNLPFRYFPQALLLPIAAFLVTREAAKRQRIALILVIILDLCVVDTELISPQSELALVNPDTVVSFLKSSITNDERVFAPYGGLSEPAPVAFDLHTADGYDPFIIKTYDDIMRRAIQCDYPDFVVGSPPTRADALAARQCSPLSPVLKLLSLLDIRFILLPQATDIPNSTLVYHDPDHWIYDVGHGYGRAFGVSRVDITDEQSCLDKLASIDDLSREAVLEHPGNTNTASPNVLSHQFVTNGEEFTVQGAGLLVRSEAWSPGWTVLIDNVPAQVAKVDCTLQGVWLPDGTHTVRFDYLPRAFIIGSVTSVLTLIGVVLYSLCLVAGYLRSRKYSVTS